MTTFDTKERPLHLELEEIQVLNRLFNVIDEPTLKAHNFTPDDIEYAYSLLGKVRQELWDYLVGIEDAKVVQNES